MKIEFSCQLFSPLGNRFSRNFSPVFFLPTFRSSSKCLYKPSERWKCLLDYLLPVQLQCMAKPSSFSDVFNSLSKSLLINRKAYEALFSLRCNKPSGHDGSLSVFRQADCLLYPSSQMSSIYVEKILSFPWH